jgi:uncharacterized protein YndB with AHSA1/START domain
MGEQFEHRRETEVGASPDEVWEAIATGPGIDSWFMGANEVDPGPDGTVRMVFGPYTPVHAITAWEPGHRLVYGSGPEEDGRSIAYEFLVEGREQGTTVLRMVVSGFLPGDGWEDEYEAMAQGGELFWGTLVAYLTHFSGRIATPVTVFGPMVDDWDSAWDAVHRELGLSAPVEVGDPVRLTLDGLPTVAGQVYATNSQTLGIRSEDAMYRLLQGFRGPMMACHHLFADVDLPRTERAWQGWLDRVVGPTTTSEA